MAHKLILLLALLLYVGSVSALTQMTVEPSSVTTRVNGDFTVTLRIDSDVDTYAIQFDVAYNPSILTLLNINEGSFLRSNFANTYAVYKPDTGRATYAITRTGTRSGISGVGDVATLRFIALRSGQSSLLIEQVKVSDPRALPVAVRAYSGLATVASAPSAQQEPPRRQTSSGGRSFGRDSKSSSFITTPSADSAQGRNGQTPTTGGEPSGIALESKSGASAQPETQETVTEGTGIGRTSFFVFFFIALALGALTYAYLEFNK